ncbi:bestrophin-4-like protein, partial [Dinothrombium tinctorium]
MGWLKVAEQLINPFGEDDDDFDLNWMLDRNLLFSLVVVDDVVYNKNPKLSKDIYWDDTHPSLPYTKDSLQLRSHKPHHGSAMNLEIDPESVEFVPMKPIMEDEEEANLYKSPPQSPTPQENHSLLSSFADIRGSRLINMLMGTSNENVSGSTPKLNERNLNPFSASFKLRMPQKRKRNQNSESTSLQISDSTLQVSATSINDDAPNQNDRFSRYSSSVPKNQMPDESTSYILDVDNPESSASRIFPHRKWKDKRFSVDETGREFRAIRGDSQTSKNEVALCSESKKQSPFTEKRSENKGTEVKNEEDNAAVENE